METKRYVLTIAVHLDKMAETIVDGDVHFRGNRNRFYIEAIEKAIANRLGDDALQVGFKVAPVEPVKNAVPDAPPVIPAKHPLTPPEGGTPALEYRDGAIRNIHGVKFSYYSYKRAPKGAEPTPYETAEEHFNRVKKMAGVIFIPIQDEPEVDLQKSPLNSPLIKRDGKDF